MSSQNHDPEEGGNNISNDLPPPLPPLPEPSPSPPPTTNSGYEVDYQVDFTKFLSVAKSMRLFPENPLPNYNDEFDKLKNAIIPQIREYLNEKQVAKVHIAIYASFFKLNSDNPEQLIESKSFHLDTKSRIFYQDSPILPKLDELFSQLSQRIEQKLYLSSDYIYEKLNHCDVLFLTHQPLRGSSYIPLPKKLARSQFLLNIKNQDVTCLELSVTASIFYEEVKSKFSSSERQNQARNLRKPQLWRPYVHKCVHTQNLKNDFEKQDLELLERWNPSLSINVYVFDESRNVILPKRISNNRQKVLKCSSASPGTKKIDQVDLLLLHDAEKNRHHYVTILNLSGLCKKLHTKSHVTMGKTFFVCRWCLSTFSREHLFQFHSKICEASLSSKQNQGQMVTLPSEGSTMQFKDGYKGVLLPFIAFADFECLSLKKDLPANVSKDGKTRKIESEQIPYAYGLKALSIHEEYQMETKIKYNHDGLIQESFFKDLKNLSHQISEVTKKNFPLNWSEEDYRRHKEISSCQSCGIDFCMDSNPPQIDHDHLIEFNNYRFTLCKNCNIRAYQNEIPLYFHNLKNYDSKILLQFLATDKIHVKYIDHVLSDSSESYWCLRLHFRCDKCVEKGLHNENDPQVTRRKQVQKSTNNAGIGSSSSGQSFFGDAIENCEGEEGGPMMERASLEEQIVMEAEMQAGEQIHSEIEAEESESEAEAEAEAELGVEAETTDAMVMLAPPIDCYCHEMDSVKVLDSYKIMSTSLSTLVENLLTKCTLCSTCKKAEMEVICETCQKELSNIFPSTSAFVKQNGKIAYLKQYLKKNAFPHELIQKCQDLEKIKEFPNQESFFSNLTMSHVGDSLYQHGLYMWQLHECKSLLDYSRLYLQVKRK